MRPSTLHSLGFSYSIYERNPKGQLNQVLWESKWEKLWSLVDRRKGDLRKTIVSVEQDRRKEARRNGLRCEICLQVFPDRYAAFGHLPCRANQVLVTLGFADFTRRIRQRGAPYPGETERLREIMLASLSGDAYLLACRAYLFVPRPDSTKEENIKQFRAEWLAGLLTYIRPDEIHSGTLSRIDRQEISRIVETFIRLPNGPQKNLIRQFFSRDIKLEWVAKTGRLPARPISDRTREAFIETVGLRGKRRAEALTCLEADYWSPRTAREAYDGNPTTFTRDLYSLKSRILGKPQKEKTPKSPAASD